MDNFRSFTTECFIHGVQDQSLAVSISPFLHICVVKMVSKGLPAHADLQVTDQLNMD